MNKTIVPSRILIPEGIDLQKWACNACDQYTSDKKYWSDLKSFVGDAPSAVNLILPEAELNGDTEIKAEKIAEKMREYLNSGIFKEYYGYVLVVRTLSNKRKRIGLVAAVNLDDYYSADDFTGVLRATENTVESRMPARLSVRERAEIELTHAMILCNDTDYSVIEKLYAKREKFEKIYDFELSNNGGKIEGYFIPDSVDIDGLIKDCEEGEMALAVGDGNHSLVAAKTVWENNKKNGVDPNHPSKYALAEIVNIQSDGIEFEPIHRVVSGVDAADFVNGLKVMLGGNGIINVVTKDYDKTLSAPDITSECYDAVDGYISYYLEEHGGSVDYIHGYAELKKLAEIDNTVGIVMPTLDKKELFPLVEQFGNLPEKTFSMGEADDKRYYLEARKIR